MVSWDATRTPLSRVDVTVGGRAVGTAAGEIVSTPSSGVSMGVVTPLPEFRNEKRLLVATAGTACEVEVVDSDRAS